jgi:hypothetical protein
VGSKDGIVYLYDVAEYDAGDIRIGKPHLCRPVRAVSRGRPPPASLQLGGAGVCARGLRRLPAAQSAKHTPKIEGDKRELEVTALQWAGDGMLIAGHAGGAPCDCLHYYGFTHSESLLPWFPPPS